MMELENWRYTEKLERLLRRWKLEVWRTIKEEKERSGKEGAEIYEEAERKGVGGSRKEGRRRNAKDGSSRVRRREKEDTTAESVVLARKMWSGNCQGDGGGV